MRSQRQNIYGWGRFPVVSSSVYRPESLAQLRSVVLSSPRILATGSRLSYGDACLGDVTIDMRRLDKILDFDSSTGMITVEAGITLDDLLRVIVPRGWFVPVTPGTKFVTVGGCVGSNVHGKNHHTAGCFGRHVRSMHIVLADGSLVESSSKKNKDLFVATLGGQGLVGVVYAIQLQLHRTPSSFVDVTYTKCSSLRSLMRSLEVADHTHEYTVAWIDTFSAGRGIVIAGNHRQRGKLLVHKEPRVTVPPFFPSFFMRSVFLRVFNAIYYHVHPSGDRVVHYDSFFYPLDALRHWNRLYGRRGFVQYQLVVPLEHAHGSVSDILRVVGKSRIGSFLTVLKRFGKGDGGLSFPFEGYTLTLDFPVCQETRHLVARLDSIVRRYGGRLYLAKDALMRKEFFVEAYPSLSAWLAVKKKYDPTNKFVSRQSTRLGLAV